MCLTSVSFILAAESPFPHYSPGQSVMQPPRPAPNTHTQTHTGPHLTARPKCQTLKEQLWADGRLMLMFHFWACVLSSLSLVYLLCKMGLQYLPHQVDEKVKKGDIGESS